MKENLLILSYSIIHAMEWEESMIVEHSPLFMKATILMENGTELENRFTIKGCNMMVCG